MTARRAGLWAAALCFGCLPNPQSLKERRESFDRGALGALLLEQAPGDMRPVGAVFGGRAELLGYRLDPDAPKAGDSVTVTLYWRAVRVMDEDYQVFVHGDALGGKAARIHADHFPAKGRYPTDVWRSGEVVADPFRLKIPKPYGGERLGVYVGLYKGDHRVPLTTAGRRPSDPANRSLAIEIRP